MSKHGLLCSVLLILAGCSTSPKYAASIQQWQGVHVDELVSFWGFPDRTSHFDDGSKTLEFLEEESVLVEGSDSSYSIDSMGPTTGSGIHTIAVQDETPDRVVNFWCRTIFTIGADGLVTSSTWEGNNCRAL